MGPVAPGLGSADLKGSENVQVILFRPHMG